MEQHVKIISILYIILGALGLLAAVAFFIGGGAIAATILSQNGNDPDAQVGAAWAGGCMTFLAAFIGILSVPSIIAGWGLGQRKSWARILTLILAVLGLLNFPIGTAIGIYAIIILMNDETKRLFPA